MASPRRHSTLIELIRDRPTSLGSSAPVRVDRVKPERSVGGASGSGGGGFDVSSVGKMFAAGRRLNMPMGYVFIAVALVLISWVGMYMIGYSRAAGVAENDRIAELTSTSDPLLAGDSPVATTRGGDSQGRNLPRQSSTRPTPRVSASGPTGTGLPVRRGASPVAANSGASILPVAEFESGLNYLIIFNGHQDEARQIAAYLLDNGIRATVVPMKSSNTWRVVGLRGFAGEQMRAGEHRDYRERVERLGRSWERDHGGSSDFGEMFFRKEK